jgi:hypothetical protein
MQAAMIVKYRTDGTVSDGEVFDHANFWAIEPDGGGNFYVAGGLYQGTVTLAGGVTASTTGTFDYHGATVVAGPYDFTAALLIKVDRGLNALWAQSAHFSSFYGTEGWRSEFMDVAVSEDGASAYGVGFQSGVVSTATPVPANYGNGVSLTASYGLGTTNANDRGRWWGRNAVIVQYDAQNGKALWGSTPQADYQSSFNTVAAGKGGNIFAAGFVRGDNTHFNFGGFGTGTSITGYNAHLLGDTYSNNDATISGSEVSGHNGVIVRYR